MNNHMKVLLDVERVRRVISHGQIKHISDFGVIVICDGDPFFVEGLDRRTIERDYITWQNIEEGYCFDRIDDNDEESYYPWGN